MTSEAAPKIGSYIVILTAGLIPIIPGLSVLSSHYTGYDIARIYQIISVIPLLAAFWLCKSNINICLVRRFAIFFCPFFGFGLLSAAFSTYPLTSLREIALWGNFCLMLIATSSSGISMSIFIKTLSLSSTLYVTLVAIILSINAVKGQVSAITEIFVGHINYRFYNHYQTLIIPVFLIAICTLRKEGIFKLVAWFGGIINFTLLAATAGRGTILGLIVGLGVIYFVYRTRAFPYLRVFAITLITGTIIYLCLFFYGALVSNTATTSDMEAAQIRASSVYSRIQLWDVAFEGIKKHPLLGAGPMHFATESAVRAAHPHNLFLQFAHEWGAPVGIYIFILSLWATKRFIGAGFIAEKRPHDQVYKIGLTYMIVAVFTDSMVSGTLIVPTSQSLAALLFGLCFRLYYADQVCNRSKHDNIPVGLFILFLCSLQIYLMINTWNEIIHLPNHLMSVINQFPNRMLSPRFWSIGWF